MNTLRTLLVLAGFIALRLAQAEESELRALANLPTEADLSPEQRQAIREQIRRKMDAWQGMSSEERGATREQVRKEIQWLQHALRVGKVPF